MAAFIVFHAASFQLVMLLLHARARQGIKRDRPSFSLTVLERRPHALGSASSEPPVDVPVRATSLLRSARALPSCSIRRLSFWPVRSSEEKNTIEKHPSNRSTHRQGMHFSFLMIPRKFLVGLVEHAGHLLSFQRLKFKFLLVRLQT